MDKDSSNRVRVRFPCQHGDWFRHMVKPVPVGRPEWCDGGVTRVLKEGSFWLADATGMHRVEYRMWWEDEEEIVDE